MMGNRDGLGKTLKRELVRSALLQTQSRNMKNMMKVFGASEPIAYDDVTDTLNVAYVNREETALAMDIFEPVVAEGTELPVIVVIHGGGFFMGDRGINRPYCRLLAHKGYLVFSLEYRLAPKANLCQQLDDVCAGLDLVGQKLISYDVDFSRLFLVADSAGAYLGAYVSAMRDSEKLQNAIGYKPSRVSYAAIGFICGMFYTNKVLEEQIYGDKRYDENFLKYMNIEHPEIIQNMPPAFIITSRGDLYNNYSIRFHRALKKGGRTSGLLYCGDEDLQHIFPIMHPEHPKSLEATERMLAWFEEQARAKDESYNMDPETKEKRNKLEMRIKDGSISNQKLWANIRERISVDKELLKRTAVIDCTREYTYEQMFVEWERYARVFSALGICSDNKSRAALCGAISAEPLFALFGLNMTGAEVSVFSYPDFLPNGMWKTMIEKEMITDLIVSDIMVTPEIRAEIEKAKAEYGLRNVLYIHSLMGGPTIGPAELIYNECNYHMLKRRQDVVFLNDLLTRYADTPIRYDDSTGERVAFIMHTSGTTQGTRKPLPFTDIVMNKTQEMMPKNVHGMVESPDADKPFRFLQTFDLSSIMTLAGQVVAPFFYGDAVVLSFFGFMHPKFIRAIDYYNVDVMQLTGFMVDKWLDMSGIDNIDFSSLKVVGLSGGYISPEKLERYRKFFKEHGYKYDIITAYGSSEVGGKPMFAPKNNDRDILGFAENTESIRIQDENDGKYYRIEDGPRTGILYRLSDLRAGNELDGKVLFEYTKIDGKDFLCTNDLIRVNEDGSLSFAGRTDKYFVNNDGRKFDSGIVETAMSMHSAVDRCAVVPIMEKRIHDTVPVFYVIPTHKGQGAAESIRQAFVDVYVRDKKIGADNIPTQFMLVEDIPLNANGKLDIFRITRERIGGEAYDLLPVFTDGELTDIQTKYVESVNSMTAGTVPHGMENHSAYNMFDLFNAAAPSGKTAGRHLHDPLGIFGTLFPEKGKSGKHSNMPEMPDVVRKAILKYGNRMVGMLTTGMKSIDFDFEDYS